MKNYIIQFQGISFICTTSYQAMSKEDAITMFRDEFRNASHGLVSCEIISINSTN